jgi:hypothetical protein
VLLNNLCGTAWKFKKIVAAKPLDKNDLIFYNVDIKV